MGSEAAAALAALATLVCAAPAAAAPDVRFKRMKGFDAAQTPARYDRVGVRAIHGDDLPRRLRILAFGASLGGQRVLDAASNLAQQSGIPARNLTLVNRSAGYSHNHPSSAYPRNAFLARLVPFLRRVGRG